MGFVRRRGVFVFLAGALLALAFLASASAITPETGVVLSGTVVDRATGTPLEATQALQLGLHDAPVGGTALWAETTNATFTNGLFVIPIGSNHPVEPAVQEAPELWMDIALGHEPSYAPRVRFHPLPSVDKAGIAFEVLAFSRLTPTSDIVLTGRIVNEPVIYDAVTIVPEILDNGGTVRFTGPPAAALADPTGVFEINLGPVPAEVANGAYERRLRLTLETQSSGQTTLFDTYEMLLTYVSDNTCMELLHLLPPGSAVPVGGGGSFGCTPPPASPPPPPDGGGGEPPTDPTLEGRVAALEAENAALREQLTGLQDQLAATNSLITILQDRMAALEIQLLDDDEDDDEGDDDDDHDEDDESDS